MYILYNPQGNTEGHSQQYASNLANGLISAGYTVGMVTSKDFDIDNIKELDDFKLIHTDIENTRSVKKNDKTFIGKLIYGFLILINNFKSFRTLSKTLKNYNYKHMSIIGGDTLSNLLFFILNPRLNKSKCSITIHNADYDLSLYKDDSLRYIFKLVSKILLKKLLKSNLIIFTHGEIMCENLANQLNCPADRINFYRVPAVHESFKKDKKTDLKMPIRLLFLGVIRYDKGFDILCKSLNELNTNIPFELIVAGSSSQVGDKYIKDLIYQYNLNKRTKLELRYLDDLELKEFIVSSDITVLPYRKTFLAKSVVMSDTVRLGTPAIATKESQNGHDVETFNVGWTFASEDHLDLKRVLELAIKDIQINNFEFNFSDYVSAHLPETVGSHIKSIMDNSNE